MTARPPSVSDARTRATASHDRRAGPGVDLDRLAVEVAGALPRLDVDQRRAALAVYRLLAAGERADASKVAACTGLPAGRVAALLERLPTATVEDGAVVGFLGLQREPGRHRLTFGGRSLATWCAWDTLFLPALVGAPARAESRCPVTGDLVVVEVDPQLGITTSSPGGALLSFLAHPVPFTGDVVAGFCRWIHFLSGAPAARAWLASAAPGTPAGVAAYTADQSGASEDRLEVTVLSLAEGVELGRRTNALVFGHAG